MIRCKECDAKFPASELKDGSPTYVAYQNDYVLESQRYCCPFCDSEEIEEISEYESDEESEYVE